MSQESEDLGRRYRESAELLQAALESYKGHVGNAVSSGVGDYILSARVKTARSLIRKARSDPNNPRSWASIQDKVGLRVTCSTSEDVRTVDELLQGESWIIVERTVKSGKEDRLFYPGIHYIVEVGSVVDSRGEPILAEIQLRTRAQDAWAVVSHKLLYKGLVRPPKTMRRVITRLSVLVELFDDEVQRMLKKRRRLPMYEPALALEALELEYESLSGEVSPASTDGVLIRLLMKAYAHEEQALSECVRAFCRAHRDTIQSSLIELAPDSSGYIDSRDWLYSHPEILAVLERAHAKPYLLIDAVRDSDYEDVIRKSCVSAGIILP
ncbi:GTP pyrophosphokinase [Clavibacter michiganensis]|uniref:RelA/SpoT domain-containing protein n=1 Tax=Clavibacter michiganensis subsp. michiganensis (strain NCPPB 382) TaxID=443906 RepID=A5CM70_CLAM3|nr:RelA/SpoT domain-containing protein [Clavibacter michiganensis]MDO4045768.1 RelA/SpoT domain-containing protein [Clavibacter michiganensis]MDO4055020.1 RelA/SpoT domain-containing protein [Clavibacter michiganensis]MDO4058216.1 RelA/SpoT domain-containing protein [Clavibacter michiganensis]MDO4070274.1 RelA/SpoT domain-containing protein [Clavibacter michiganensis]MDO4076538.1 RelA/SpoT domain-containing protein [Clavibacter michiganensis]